ncbi:MAG: MEMO1 family protein [Candidatus Bathyarchaeia archaeon]
MKVRRPCQAGAFYPGSRNSLLESIEECFLSPLGPGRKPTVNPRGERLIKGLVCPHAGYMYSGPVAAYSYLALAEDGKPDVAVILGPNHTGLGSGVSIMVEGVWETPLGRLEVDEGVAEKISSSSDIIDVDDTAHLYEHSIEVQLPFLQYLYGEGLKIAPICMMMQDLETSREVAEAVYKAVQGLNYIVLASTDMTHYEPQSEAKKKDGEAIKSILTLDEEGLHNVINRLNVSMCGYGPVTVFIRAMKLDKALNVTLLKYATSGDVTGDVGAVVGYAAVKAST